MNRRLVPMSELVRLSGKSENMLANYKKLGLTSGFRESKSLGPHRGRRVLYDQDEILGQVKRIEADLQDGHSLEEQSRQRGWLSRGSMSFAREAVLRDLVRKLCSSWDPAHRKCFDRVVHFVARAGLLTNENMTLPWELKFEGGDVVVRFDSPIAMDEFNQILVELSQAMKSGTADTVVTLATARQELRDLDSWEPSIPMEVGNRVLRGAEKKTRRRENAWAAERRDYLEMTAKLCLTAGTGFPSHFSRTPKMKNGVHQTTST